MRSRLIHAVIGLGLVLYGCEQPKAEVEKAPPPKPVSSPAKVVAPPPAPTPSVQPAPAPATPVAAKVNGVSLSTASTDDFSAALKSAGWKYISGGGMAIGANETKTIRAEKGPLKAEITLVRPTGKADEGGMKMQSAADQKASFAAKGAAYLEGNVLLAVVIEGKQPEAQKLLDALIQK